MNRFWCPLFADCLERNNMNCFFRHIECRYNNSDSQIATIINIYYMDIVLCFCVFWVNFTFMLNDINFILPLKCTFHCSCREANCFLMCVVIPLFLSNSLAKCIYCLKLKIKRIMLSAVIKIRDQAAFAVYCLIFQYFHDSFWWSAVMLNSIVLYEC